MKRSALVVLAIALAAAGCTAKSDEAAKLRGRAIASVAIANRKLAGNIGPPTFVIDPPSKKYSVEEEPAGIAVDEYHYACQNPNCRATGRMFRPKGTEPPEFAECPKCKQKTMKLTE